ncbi:MAG: hypothetical protein QOH93_1914 [Chloroflexia bacterium]|jgi:hypothetical protein|nr:hypothetical protein [Chloroflexia bacterium]
MDLRITSKGDRKIVEGPPGMPLLQSPDDIVEVIGACFEHRTGAVLLYAENMPDGFFDLSSGEAGAVLQKLRNYHIRLAIVADMGALRQSSKFPEMVLEESKAGDFRMFEDRGLAEGWLVGE